MFPIVISEAQLQGIIDAGAAWVAQNGTPLEKIVVQAAQAVLDKYGLPALYAFLQARGIVTPPAA